MTFSLKNLMLSSILTVSVLSGCGGAKKAGTDTTSAETTAADPANAKIYTLKNGMKLYLSVYKDAPRVQTMIATRAGSKNDPSDCTGLAHYLEHMLFKGTSKIGSLNWDKEKVMLQQISDLYEQHKAEKDPAKRKVLYAKIDSVSQIAAGYVHTNEYDKMISSLGAKGTNAFTSMERTVYVNDIPSNEIEKWMSVESERFQECVLRLFHTELEAVYEEFNIGQDNDGRKAFSSMMLGLFPSHTYGTQTTIGTSEHLKSPSHVKIQEFFKKYYVPNNMALVISGDIDPDKVVQMAEKYFGSYQMKDVPKWTFEKQAEITKPIEKHVTGLESEWLDMGWRLAGTGTDESILGELVAQILSNGQAGLIDINLLQEQKVGTEAYAFTWALTDYTLFSMHALPRTGQSLDEVRGLLTEQLTKLGKGDFGDWLIAACVKNAKLASIKQMESNSGRARYMLEAFITNQDYDTYNKYYDRMAKFTKQDVMNFVNKYITANNCVVLYKHQGKDESVVKVEKPAITKLSVNRSEESEFKKSFDKMASPRTQPDFLDFKKLINSQDLGKNIRLDYIKNPYNQTFSMNYIFEMGKNNDRKLPMAVNYLKFLGTDKYTAAELQKEFFKLGLAFDVYAGDDRCYITLSGLDESFEDGIKLFEHILANVQPNEEALTNMKSDILKDRNDKKKDKGAILREAMLNYAKYGSKSAYTDLLMEKDLNAVSSAELIGKIKQLSSYEHQVFYYGSLDASKVKNVLVAEHKTPAQLKPIPAATDYAELATPKNKVVFVNFPIVQAEVLMISKGTDHFDLNEYISSRLYNEYFGLGLSGIVFQEIREAKALAYSAYSNYSSPTFSNKAHYYTAYVGTQADKLKDAVTAMRAIIDDMPVSEDQIIKAREAIMKQIESERITKDRIYWLADANARRGYDRDLRQDIYNKMKAAEGQLGQIKDDLLKFQREKVKNRPYTCLILGDKSRVDMEFLKTIGTVEELTLEHAFGY